MTERQDTILEYTGADNMENVIDVFAGMTQKEIQAELNYIFAYDDNVELSELISLELAEA